MPFKLSTAVLLASVLHVAGARADDAAAPMFSFRGFGTVGVAHSSEARADFASSVFKPNGAGHSRASSFDVDSLIAAQLTATFTPQLSAVLQVVAEQNYDNSYGPHVEWANVKYQATPDLSIRAGRIVLPAFLVSDYRKVGYANPWVRPPVEVYGLLPVSNSDGIDASYRAHLGDFTNTVQGTYGRTAPRLPGGLGAADGRGLWGISNTGEYGALTARVAYVQASVTVDAFKPLFDGFRQFGAEGNVLANKYGYDNKRFTFLGIGGMYDPGGWFAMAEWGVSDRRSVLGKRTAWYVSGGYRHGRYTPYFTYARTRADSNTSDAGLTLAGLPPSLTGAASGLNTSLNGFLATVPVQQTISAGGRWDFAKSTALKLQFDHTRVGSGSSGTLINIQSGFQPGGRYNVFSATIDFVF